MGRLRRLSDEQMAQAQWDFENTRVSERQLAAKYGMSKAAMRKWIIGGKWLKWTGQSEVKAEIAHDTVIAKGLDVTRQSNHRRDKKRIKEAAEAEQAAPAPEPQPQVAKEPSNGSVTTADQPDPPPATRRPGRPPKVRPEIGTNIVAFPGLKPPPKIPPASMTSIPIRDKRDRIELRMKLASLRGMVSIEQLRQIEQHERVLEDYTHYLSVYLSPHDYVKVTGLEDEAAQEKLMQVQRAALSLLLPTERDTLVGALKGSVGALVSLVQLKREVAGLLKSNEDEIGKGLDDDEEDARGNRAGEVSMETLRDAQRVMEALNGKKQRDREPPKPPAPEGLDDLRPPPPVAS